jgi:5'-nucleotidase
MRILISNDDGIFAKGIQALAHEISKHAQVCVVAPDSQRSASSHGISLNRALSVNAVDFGSEQITAYSVSGTPVDCVKWGVVMLGRKQPFDLMLSGINEGTNLATDVLYSGTVAAAGEAALQGIPSIAFSLKGPPFPFEDAAKTATDLTLFFADKKFPADTFLNVNLPPLHVRSAKWCATELGARGFTNDFIQKTDESGNIGYLYSGEELEELGSDRTDVKALRRGEISITPLRYRFTNDLFLDSLSAWL